MTRITQILIMILLPNLIFGQNRNESLWKSYIDSDIISLNLEPFDKSKQEKIFRIWNSHQVVELIKINDSTFSGQLVNFVAKVNKKENRKKTFYQKLLIPDFTAKELIQSLELLNIESLPDSYEVEGYINGLDGETVVFEINLTNTNRIYSYWEPEDDQYQNGDIEKVQKVRKILQQINSKIDLDKFFDDFIFTLPPGRYLFDNIIMTKK